MDHVVAIRSCTRLQYLCIEQFLDLRRVSFVDAVVWTFLPQKFIFVWWLSVKRRSLSARSDPALRPYDYPISPSYHPIDHDHLVTVR